VVSCLALAGTSGVDTCWLRLNFRSVDRGFGPQHLRDFVRAHEIFPYLGLQLADLLLLC
jgi:hypothetical protein